MSLLWIPLICLVVTMLFSAAEMAFIAANRVRLRHLAEEGHGVAAEYLEAFRNPERTLATAMMGVTIAHVVASSAGTFALLPVLGGLAPVVVTLVLTPVMLVFGEIIPKAVAREWATPLVLNVEPNSPAQRAGLAVGDVIIGFNDVMIETIDDLQRQLTDQRVGEACRLRVIRHTEKLDLEITPVESLAR